MSNKLIDKIKSKAEELYQTRKDIDKVEEAYKLTVDPLKARRDQLQQELIELYNEVGITSIKTEAGETYAKAMRKGLMIKDDRKALTWAIENNCANINKIYAAQVIFKQEEIPAGFEVVQSEYISVRKPKADKEPEEK